MSNIILGIMFIIGGVALLVLMVDILFDFFHLDDREDDEQ